MNNPPASAIADAVAEYRTNGDVPKLLSRLRAITQSSGAAELAAAVEPFRDIPEVAGPVYEVIVAQRPDDARALVILANAYWLAGRGPDVVGALASRAIAADATNRGAWHLWAITAEALRERVTRWHSKWFSGLRTMILPARRSRTTRRRWGAGKMIRSRSSWRRDLTAASLPLAEHGAEARALERHWEGADAGQGLMTDERRTLNGERRTAK